MLADSSLIEPLFSWEVLSIGVGILVSAGFTLLADEFRQFNAAKVCFAAAAVWLFGKVIVWGMFTSDRFSVRAGLTALACALIGIGVVEAMRLAASREAAVRISESTRVHINSPMTVPDNTGANPSPAPPASQSKSPIDRLSELGWTVRAGTTDIQFEVASRPIPDMGKSVSYFRRLRKPFRLHFQSVKGISGLHFLAGINGCTMIEINAGEFTDISELDGLSQITNLIISQTPIDGLSTIDLSAVSSLSNLRELNLFSSKFADLKPIIKLSKLNVLNLKDTPIRDLAPVTGLVSLESLDITGTGANNLTPLRDMENLRELGVGGKQTPGLIELRNLKSLKVLRIIDQGPVDLSPVGELPNLESLFIWGPPALNLAPLGKLRNLKELQISGMGFGALSTVTNVEALGNLQELRKLTLGSLQVSDLNFVRRLGHLNELNIGMMPIASIEAVRGLVSLKSVSLNLTNVVDISPLLELPSLSNVSVLRTPARADVLTQLERNGVKVQR